MLSGYQEVLSDPSYAGPDHHLHLPPHRQLRGQRRRRREPPALRPGRGRARPGPAASNWRATDDLDAYLRRHGVPGIAGVDTRRLTRHIREAGAMPGRLRRGRRGDAQGGGRPPSPAPTASTWWPPSPAPSPTRWPAARPTAGASWPTTSASSARSCATWRAGRGHGGAGRHAGRRGAGPRARRRVPVQRPRRPGRRSATPPRPSAACWARCRVRHLPGPPAAGHRARRHHPQAAVRPPRRQPPGAPPGDRPGRDHQPEPQLRGGRGLARPRRRGHPRQPQRRGGRGHPGARPAGVRRAVPPRGRARAPTTPPTCSTSSPR